LLDEVNIHVAEVVVTFPMPARATRIAALAVKHTNGAALRTAEPVPRPDATPAVAVAEQTRDWDAVAGHHVIKAD
jgi:hypothetical protein